MYPMQHVFATVGWCYCSFWGKKLSFIRLRPFRISQAQPKRHPTRTLSISLCLVFHMHHTQSLTLFILQPVSFFLHLFSSDGCHYTRYAPLEVLTQLSLLCLTLTERLRPLLWLISPCRLFLRWLISSLFPSLFRLLFTHAALNRLRLASSKDYRNHHLSLSVLELIGLTAPLWREGCDCGVQCGPNTRGASLVDAPLPAHDCQSCGGKQRLLQQSAGRMECGETERVRESARLDAFHILSAL